MNTCMALTCGICERDTDCRIGYSNRLIQPLRFACPHCGSAMEVTLDTSDAPRSNFSYNGCKPSNTQPKGPFTGENPFVDLHLDFPVRFGTYVMGMTPYMMASMDLDAGEENGLAGFAKMQFHNHRLNQLNNFHDQADRIKAIIRLYGNANKQLFRKRVGEFLEEDQGSSLRPEDVNASLYTFISRVFLPFVKFGEVSDAVEQFTEHTMEHHGPALSAFMDRIIGNGFLATLQKDCLKLYPDIFEAEMPLRPALFLDLLPERHGEKAAARISSKDFLSYKDLYKDIVEVFARQLTLVAGINNVIHRGDYNSFKPLVAGGAALSSLERFSEKTLSEKYKYLDDCWHALDDSAVDAKVRNAIAHYNVDYNEITQEITYYPDGGGLEQGEPRMMYFLEFMRLLLSMFREMHQLHHLIKCLFYYEFLIRNKAK